jgi:hypothetical protein
MAAIGSSHNDAFSDGLNYAQNTGRANDNSVTLGGSLQATSDRWNSLTPHGVLGTTVGTSSQDDGAWQDYERDAGGYKPGQFEQMTDQLSLGNDNLP